MDMKHLHYFCVIVEDGQITKAARTLNIPASTESTTQKYGGRAWRKADLP